MKRSITKLKIEKEKFSGNLKKVAGKITGNEQLELKGRIQTANADMKQKTGLGKTIHEIKEAVAAKINNLADKK